MSRILSPSESKKALKKLRASIVEHKDEILEALRKDLGKSDFEGLSTEYYIVLKEIDTSLKLINKERKTRWIKPSLLNFPSAARLLKKPFGKVLIIAPWNYPFQLVFAPLAGALAAGNTAVVKPSELSEATADICKKIIEDCFEPITVDCELGGVEVSQKLLKQRWDYIFFTGSVPVGKIVAQAAAVQLCPTTLELGGKNPCVVRKDANLKVAARRIAWGKYMNCGQTCIAPDYILIDSNIKSEFLKALKDSLKDFYPQSAEKSEDYGRIINSKNFNRLQSYLDGQTILIGGNADASKNFIEPTVIENPSLDSSVMKDEIFGPILPIFTYDDEQEIDQFINQFEHPLAMYVFTKNSRWAKKLLKSNDFGGGGINDIMPQFINSGLPFGGVGHSGMGAYHGKYTIRTFLRPVGQVEKFNWLDLPVRYAPYEGKRGLMAYLMKYLA